MINILREKKCPIIMSLFNIENKEIKSLKKMEIIFSFIYNNFIYSFIQMVFFIKDFLCISI